MLESFLFNSLETLFWAIFGLVDLDRMDLSVPHYVTEWAGKTMFGSYGVISLVVLLNMLIAMMSNSYEYIANQADVEWKFARSKLWIEYFEESGTLPPPFNIIPSPKTIYYVLSLISEKCCHCTMHHRRIKQRSLRLQKILKAVSQKEANYQYVMRSLVKRYIAFVQRVKQQSDGVTEDDVNEIKQDISSFRYELLEILRSAGFETGHNHNSQKITGKNKRRTAQAERRMMKSFQIGVDTIPESDPSHHGLDHCDSEPNFSTSSFQITETTPSTLQHRNSSSGNVESRPNPALSNRKCDSPQLSMCSTGSVFSPPNPIGPNVDVHVQQPPLNKRLFDLKREYFRKSTSDSSSLCSTVTTGSVGFFTPEVNSGNNSHVTVLGSTNDPNRLKGPSDNHSIQDHRKSEISIKCLRCGSSLGKNCKCSNTDPKPSISEDHCVIRSSTRNNTMAENDKNQQHRKSLVSTMWKTISTDDSQDETVILAHEPRGQNPNFRRQHAMSEDLGSHTDDAML